MTWADIPFHPESRTLRQFAGLWILFFGALAAWQGLHETDWLATFILGSLAVTIGPLGLVAPGLIRPIFVGWMILAFPIGWTISRVLLACLFYGLFTPLALCFKLMGRDVLCRRPLTAQDSYWRPKLAAPNVQQYFHQF